MRKLLYSGWLAAIFFIFGSVILGSLLPDYSMVSQTVSEIGEKGSALYFSWQFFGFLIAALLIAFSIGLLIFARKKNFSRLPGILVLFAGLSELGIAFFPSPHDLHNVFGLSMTLGYFAPLAFFLLWKDKLGQAFKKISLAAFILIIMGIFLNLSPAFAPKLYPIEYYGLVQRFLLFTFYLYLGFVSMKTLSFI